MNRPPTPETNPPATRARRTGLAGLAALAAAALWIGAVPGPDTRLARAAAYDLDEATRTLLVEAVEAAAALDFYSARCRSDVSGRHIDNLNKELVGTLRITVIGVQDDLFPERSFRAAQARMQEQAQELLREAGGCAGAKESGLADRLKETYRERLEAVEALP